MNLTRENKVYIIDDDTDVAQSTVTLLETQGLKTALFNSAEAFMMETDPTISGCVVSDYELKGNWNGTDLLRKTQALGYRVPFIVASSSMNHSAQMTAKKSGAFAILEKPYPAQVLFETIHAALNHHDRHFPE